MLQFLDVTSYTGVRSTAFAAFASFSAAKEFRNWTKADEFSPRSGSLSSFRLSRLSFGLDYALPHRTQCRSVTRTVSLLSQSFIFCRLGFAQTLFCTQFDQRVRVRSHSHSLTHVDSLLAKCIGFISSEQSEAAACFNHDD